VRSSQLGPDSECWLGEVRRKEARTLLQGVEMRESVGPPPRWGTDPTEAERGDALLAEPFLRPDT